VRDNHFTFIGERLKISCQQNIPSWRARSTMSRLPVKRNSIHEAIASSNSGSALEPERFR
jgi:hypothetical protein